MTSPFNGMPNVLTTSHIIDQDVSVSESDHSYGDSESNSLSLNTYLTLKCIMEDCSSKAVGKSKKCIKHGGGLRCIALNCEKSAQGSTKKCVLHGGGLRCLFEDCISSAQGSSKHKQFCVVHGGGNRCTVHECKSSAIGNTNLCKRHGGGIRCTFSGCINSSQGKSDKCKRHGGGNRCIVEDCFLSAQGKTQKCISHGGGARCIVENCTSSAIAKTEKCIAHGGGNRCIIENCTSSAIGKTEKCKRHGGGFRCKIKDCLHLTTKKEVLCLKHRHHTDNLDISQFSDKIVINTNLTSDETPNSFNKLFLDSLSEDWRKESDDSIGKDFLASLGKIELTENFSLNINHSKDDTETWSLQIKNVTKKESTVKEKLEIFIKCIEYSLIKNMFKEKNPKSQFKAPTQAAAAAAEETMNISPKEMFKTSPSKSSIELYQGLKL